MTPVICQVKHDPPNSYGDCVRACIASLFDLDPPKVPHFAHDGCDFNTMIQRIREWLKGGLFLTYFPASAQLSEIREHMAINNPGVYYMLFSENHVVICKGGKIVHDPAWYKTSLVQPTEAWAVGVLTII